MKQKIELMHPAGKKAIRMDCAKYDLIKKSLILFLQKNCAATHKEIFNGILHDFKKNKITFDGSVEWHMEWVKLDLEARKEIKKDTCRSPATYSVI
jgi:hypothetical protein